jgi:hypothetical protein
MRRLLGSTLVLLLFAPVALAQRGGAPLSDAKRQAAAVATVKQAIKPWVRSGEKLKVRTAIVGFAGDKRNPITGSGPIEVYVKQEPAARAGLLGRIARRFDKFASRKFTVDVDRNGNAAILAQESHALHHRVGRFLSGGLAAKELAADAIQSRGAREGVVTALLGGAAIEFSPAVTAVGLFRAAQVTIQGIGRRREARKQAFDSTTAWARKEGRKAGGGYPTLMEAYRHYQMVLEEAKPGTTPMPIKQFAERLAASGL